MRGWAPTPSSFSLSRFFQAAYALVFGANAHRRMCYSDCLVHDGASRHHTFVESLRRRRNRSHQLVHQRRDPSPRRGQMGCRGIKVGEIKVRRWSEETGFGWAWTGPGRIRLCCLNRVARVRIGTRMTLPHSCR
jgi:hypothetical protein